MWKNVEDNVEKAGEVAVKPFVSLDEKKEVNLNKLVDLKEIHPVPFQRTKHLVIKYLILLIVLNISGNASE